MEFYLPQIAHMIIHLEVDWPTTCLERYALMISQTSFHAALQLTYILYAAMEDYQPEDATGLKNVKFDQKLFLRCARLLRNVERAVVYGSPAIYEMESDEPQADINESEKKLLEDAERINFATNIIERSLHENSDASYLQGKLYYKRGTRRMLHLKRWKPRWFKIDQQMLLCFRDENYRELRRAIPLKDCELNKNPASRHQYSFEVYSPTSRMLFKLYAESSKYFDTWTSAIQR